MLCVDWYFKYTNGVEWTTAVTTTRISCSNNRMLKNTIIYNAFQLILITLYHYQLSQSMLFSKSVENTRSLRWNNCAFDGTCLSHEKQRIPSLNLQVHAYVDSHHVGWARISSALDRAWRPKHRPTFLPNRCFSCKESLFKRWRPFSEEEPNLEGCLH